MAWIADFHKLKYCVQSVGKQWMSEYRTFEYRAFKYSKGPNTRHPKSGYVHSITEQIDFWYSNIQPNALPEECNDFQTSIQMV
jgi:hypothetical protein